MTVLDDIRAQYPQYANVPDGKLAAAIRKKYYADMPAPEFYRKAGLAHLVGISEKPANGLGSDSENFWAGMGKSAMDNLRGLKQLGMAVSDPFGVQQAMSPAYNAESAQLKQDQADVNARDSALMHTKAGLGGNITGQALQAIAGGTLLKGAGMAGNVLPAGYRGAALSGAVQGAMQPLATGEGGLDRLGNTALGAGAGLLGQGVVNVGGAVLKAGKGLIAPFLDSGQDSIVANTLRRFAGNADVAVTPSAVQGVQPTLAEATGDAGIAGLQRTVLNSDPAIAAQFAGRREANNAARVGLLQDIAGTPQDIAAAKAAREQAAGDLYRQAFAQDVSGVKPSEKLLDLAKRPAFQAAIEDAKTLALNAGEDVGNPLTSIKGLHYIKLALDDALTGNAKSAMGDSAKRSLTSIKNELVDEIGNLSPAYAQAKTAFQQGSVPLNQRQIVGGLLDRATTGAPDSLGNPVLTPARYANAVGKLDQIAQKATRFNGAKADNILTPQQRDTVQGILGDLSRQNVADNAGRAVGSNTVQNLASQSLLGDVAHGLGLPGLADSGLLGRLTGVLDTGYKAFGIPDQLKEKLARVLLDPTSAEAQRILAKLPKSQRSAVQSYIASMSGLVGQSSSLGVGQQPALQR